MCGAYRGDGAAEGRDVRQDGNILSGGVREGVFVLFLFLSDTFSPLEKRLNTAFWGPTVFFGHSCVQGGACKKEKKTGFNLKKNTEDFKESVAYGIGHDYSYGSV